MATHRGNPAGARLQRGRPTAYARLYEHTAADIRADLVGTLTQESTILADEVVTETERLLRMRRRMDVIQKEADEKAKAAAARAGHGHGGHGGHGHSGHGGRSSCSRFCMKYFGVRLVSVIFVGMLQYVFCVLSAIVIHDSHKKISKYISVGITLQTACGMVAGLFSSRYSKIGATIGGPDIIAPIFYADMVNNMLGNKDIGLTSEQYLPTLLFILLLGTSLIAITWLAIGYTGLTRATDCTFSCMSLCERCGEGVRCFVLWMWMRT